MTRMGRIENLLANPRAIYFLVALFVALGALYSVTTPLFEAGDELWHYPHVQWIARGNGLPVQDPAQAQLWEQEGGQPPLYYTLAAATTFWVDTSDLRERLWRNPFAKIGVPLAYGNKNMVVHTSAENFPWQNTALAVHLIRLMSVLFSAATVFLTYNIAREISLALHRSIPPSLHRSIPPALALIAAAIVAFNPMFLFISASVNNDSLAALLATGAIFLCVQLVTRDARNLRVFILGIVVALAVLTKVSNLALGIVAVTVLAYCAWKQSSFRFLIRAGILFLIPILVLDAWWFARNYFLYGDPLAFNVWLQIAGGRPPQTLLGLLDEFQGFRISFWGNFGGVNVIAPEWVYTTLDVFTLLAGIGLVIGAVRRTLPALLWIPALQLGIVLLALIRWTLLTYASQGRLIFPAIASAAILFTFGLYALTPRASRLAARGSLPIVPTLFVLLLFVFALAAPLFLIAPAYAQPARLAHDASAPNPVHIFFDAGGAQPELVGYDAPRFARGNELPLTLYWRTAAPIAEDLAMYVHVYDARGNLLGQWDAFPGNGLAPTRLWQPNEILVDEYHVPVALPKEYPPLGRIEVGLSRVGSQVPLTARDPAGNEITPTLARFKLSQPTGARVDTRAVLGEQFGLVALTVGAQRGAQGILLDANPAQSISLRPGDVLNVRVTLQARQIPDADYVLFAHVVDAHGNIVAQRDAQPSDNLYPTSLWNENERVGDVLSVPLPQNLVAGKYSLEFGVYRADNLTRLPVEGANWGMWQVQGDHLVASIEVVQ